MLPRSSLELAPILSVTIKKIYIFFALITHMWAHVYKRKGGGWLSLLACKCASAKSPKPRGKGRHWWYAASVVWICVMGHNWTSKGGSGSGSPWAWPRKKMGSRLKSAIELWAEVLFS
jgi:hypothetical protein